MSLQMLGVKTVPLQTYAGDRFYPSPELCEKLITDKTKAIVLVSPNNPVRSEDSVIRTLLTIITDWRDLSAVLDSRFRIPREGT